ncbi:MAG: hypothetical protein KDK74_14255 [Cephaloticoccus sp.]|nr:hypothetical protein [Cephaloticoccus sp.]
MIKLAQARLIAFPTWVLVALACALANPFCCHLLPVFDGFESSLPAQIDEAQQLCAGKPLKPMPAPESLATGRAEFVVAVLPHGGFERVGTSLSARPLPIRELRGPPRHLVLGILRI